MTRTDICVFRSSLAPPAAVTGERVVSDDQVREWVKTGRILGHAFRYRTSRLLTERMATAGRPMLAWVVKLMARGRSVLVDLAGDERELTLPLLVGWSCELARDAIRKDAILERVGREVDSLAKRPAPNPPALDRSGSALYLRTDVSFGVRAGGSVGHIAGVVNELDSMGARPIVLTTADVPTIRTAIEVHRVGAPEAFWNFQEMPTIVMNDVFRASVARVVGDRRIAFIYQRYSLNNYAGLDLARRFGVPFVLEYNGSEIWMGRHWGRPLKYESLAERIEMLNVHGADLVVVVSRAMRDELVARGADPERILVNPNAVDTDRYHPGIDGNDVIARYGLAGKTVVGFVGTFQPWHGAEALARAFVDLTVARPELRGSVRLLMIGDGPGLAGVKEMLGRAGVEPLTAFTGLVPQAEGAKHMAACDVLVSPHVPNPDGTRFFGSPTKLFEYMAMGKAILASDLEQIGEVLRHGVTAWMVPPADVAALAAGLARLLDDPSLRRALGEAARREALERHTWRAHVFRTSQALMARVAAVETGAAGAA